MFDLETEFLGRAVVVAITERGQGYVETIKVRAFFVLWLCEHLRFAAKQAHSYKRLR